MKTLEPHVEVLDAEEKGEDIRPAFALTNRASIERLCAVFTESERRIRAGFAEIADAEDAINALFTLGEHGYKEISVRDRYNRGSNFRDADAAITCMRRDAWGTLIDRLELRRGMSVQRWKALQKSLKDDEPLPLTLENVYAFADRFAADLPTMFAEAVREVFHWLRPRAHTWRMDDFKTNQKNARYEIGPKIILCSIVSPKWSGKLEVNHHAEQRLLALDNVFSGLDGKGTIAKTHRGPLVDAINACERGAVAETNYFKARSFKNGRVHLEFRRLDLVAKFNRVAGGQNLKPHEEVA